MSSVPSSIREQSEITEMGALCSEACLSRNTLGRRHIEDKCTIRTDFQRDRDRIIHSTAFRRLKGKTQVFLAPVGDHYRTRLTHTLEVSQIARTIARALKLNEDLTEAIALAHDLGHTPFGHSGEAALDEISNAGFKHYLQSVRVCDYIEKNGTGLNLTKEVLNGIATHGTKTPDSITREGCIVCLSDKIAYINHDIEDAIRAGILKEQDLPKDCTDVLGKNKSARISSMVKSVINNGVDTIKMDAKTKSAHDKLRDFLFSRVYDNTTAKQSEERVAGLIEKLFTHFLKNPDKMPEIYVKIASKRGTEQAVIDYVSGMTDAYAVEIFENLYIPKRWTIT
ncbi:MAG: deoxyguanosinetriphosphate triphosphohydrolase [Ruminococcus sp.]|jgi:dGTPase|nr:deoxyguanosinetriphosphate triphosphohydrolase [Ruminococcus sp.]